MPSPLLSICIPAYNGAQYLRVSLEALLPQVREAAGVAEVLVIDDASTDNTAAVVAEAQQHGPVRYIRNPANLGSAKNIVRGPVELATGEFVAVWSQHCLIYPGALRRLLQVLEQKCHLDAFYINFRCARYPQDWPNQALGGYDGPYHYLSNLDLRNRDVQRWEELLDVRTGAGTQSYAHVVKRSIWVRYWAGRPIASDFTNVFATFPHACTVAENAFGKPSHYVGEPVITIFNGAQWWNSTRNRVRVNLQGYPDLLELYRRLGWHRERLKEAQAYNAEHYARESITQFFRHPQQDEGKVIVRYLFRHWYHKGILRALWKSFIESECCWLARFIPRCGARFNKAYRYCFHNCRPARWVRANRQKESA